MCGVCQTAVAQGEPSSSCPACQAPYHTDCWEENRGCAAYGCSKVPPTEPRSPLEFTPAYWGQENKPCPKCTKQILAAAVRCRHCGAQFESARPVNASEFAEKESIKSRLGSLEKTIIIIFAFSTIPLTAPIGCLAGFSWYAAHRRDVSGTPSFYRALLKIGLGVGAFQTCAMIVLAVLYAKFGGRA